MTIMRIARLLSLVLAILTVGILLAPDRRQPATVPAARLRHRQAQAC